MAVNGKKIGDLLNEAIKQANLTSTPTFEASSMSLEDLVKIKNTLANLSEEFGPITNSSFDGFASALGELAATPGASTERGWKPTVLIEKKKAGTTMTKRLKLKPDNMIVDELTATDVSIKANTCETHMTAKRIVSSLNDALLGKAERTVELRAPESLTVFRAKGYGVIPHTGMEEFRFYEAYLSKRGKIVCKFKPLAVSSYLHMEMKIEDAINKLVGMDEELNALSGGSYSELVKDIQLSERIAVEESAVQEKSKDYASFGSW